MRAALYVRISQDSAEGAGVRRQETECRELAVRRGWTVTEVFTDNDVSATSGRRRPGFEEMKHAIRAGQVDAVVAWHQDRLWRVMGQDTLDLMELARERSLPIACVASPDIDMTTPDGEMVAMILTATATAEIRRASVRQKARWRQRKADGKLVTLGRRPFGLQRKGDTMVPVKKEADAVRHAARELIAGRSLYAVVKELPPTPYGNAWRAQHFRRTMMSDHLVTYGILDADTHRLVKARLAGGPNKPKPQGRPPREYALSGIVFCGLCGSKLAASSGSFHCQDSQCGRIGIKASVLNPFVLGQLYDHLPPEQPESSDALPAADKAALAELGDIEDRIAELTAALSTPGAPVDVLAVAVTQAQAKRDELTQRLGQPTQGPSVDFTRLLSGDLDQLVGGDRRWIRSIIEKVTITKASNGRWTPVQDRVEITWAPGA